MRGPLGPLEWFLEYFLPTHKATRTPIHQGMINKANLWFTRKQILHTWPDWTGPMRVSIHRGLKTKVDYAVSTIVFLVEFQILLRYCWPRNTSKKLTDITWIGREIQKHIQFQTYYATDMGLLVTLTDSNGII